MIGTFDAWENKLTIDSGGGTVVKNTVHCVFLTQQPPDVNEKITANFNRY